MNNVSFDVELEDDSAKYSHNDIIALFYKGADNMNNISFDMVTEDVTYRCYFKGNNRKMINLNTKEILKSSEDQKDYLDPEKVTPSDYYKSIISKVPQYSVLLKDDANKEDSWYVHRFIYIRDEKQENKDCIMVQERLYIIKSQSYTTVGQTTVYWVEKSTGFIIGTANVQVKNINTAKPQTIIKNIKCGEVTDSMF